MAQLNPVSQNKFVLFSAIGIATSLTIAFSAPAHEPVQQSVFAQVAPSSFGVNKLTVLDDNTGTAQIYIDSFTLDVSFEYTKFEDHYGVQGSHFDSAVIDSLKIDLVTDRSGAQISDFTDFNDHLNINALLVNHMISKKLV